MFDKGAISVTCIPQGLCWALGEHLQGAGEPRHRTGHWLVFSR